MRQTSGMGEQFGKALDALRFVAWADTFTSEQLAEEMECSRRHAYRMVAVMVARDVVVQIGENRWSAEPTHLWIERRRKRRRR